MSRRAAACLICVASAFSVVSSNAQTTTAATAQPVVTAEHEPWFLSGEPLTHEGYLYYPVGALTAFNRNEMVRSGFYRGIPLYTRTTLEPWSVVYVPASGGFMQPYVRRRAGEIAGTIGSLSPGMPIERDDTSRALTQAPLMAPGPPTNLPDTPVDRVTGAAPPEPLAVATAGRVEPGTAGTAGAGATLSSPGASRVVVLPRPRALATAARPTGVNSVYVEFDSRRWYSSGSAVELDSGFRHVGDYHGFPVYARGADASTIYIPVTTSARALVAPYSKRR